MTLVRNAHLLWKDMLEKVAKGELPEDAPDELSNLLIDRDTCEQPAPAHTHWLIMECDKYSRQQFPRL